MKNNRSVMIIFLFFEIGLELVSSSLVFQEIFFYELTKFLIMSYIDLRDIIKNVLYHMWLQSYQHVIKNVLYHMWFTVIST